MGREEGCISARLELRDGPASPQLSPNSCLLPRAMPWLYVVFLKLHYQKFNNSKSTLLLLMCVPMTNGPDERRTIFGEQTSFIMLD